MLRKQRTVPPQENRRAAPNLPPLQTEAMPAHTPAFPEGCSQCQDAGLEEEWGPGGLQGRQRPGRRCFLAASLRPPALAGRSSHHTCMLAPTCCPYEGGGWGLQVRRAGPGPKT